MKLPAIFRKKNAAGKYTGNCRIRLNGLEINLGTSDQNEAVKRRLEAVRRGRRNFADEIDEAADAVEDLGGEAERPTGAHTPGTGGATPPPATAAPVRPDAVIPPPPAPPVPLLLPPATPASDAAAEAEATNEAAAEGDAGADQAAAAGAEPPIPEDALDGMLEMGAMLLVDVQLQLQATLIRRRLKREPGPIPPDAPQRAMAAKAWVAQLKVWFPSAVQMPPWAWALLIPAGCMVQQVAASTPLKDKKDETQPPAESGAPPVQAAA